MTTTEIRRRSESLVSEGRVQEAGQLIEQALQLQPFDTQLIIAKANVMLAGRQYRQAIEVLKELVQRRPEVVDAHFLLGNAYRAVELFAEAVECYEEVARRAPGFPSVYHFLGIARQYSGDLAGSEQAYRKAVERRPELALLHFRLGAVLHLQSRHGEAIAAYQEALKREPGHQQALTNLGLALLATERDEEAFEVARGHVAQRPNNTMALANLVYSAVATDRQDIVEKILDYDRLLATDRIQPPEGQELEPFLADVVSCVKAAPKLQNVDETLYTTRNGYITRELGTNNGNAIEALSDVLRRQVETYIERCRAHGDHPWAANIPEQWRLKIWGNVQGSGGHENPHCHPRAFISGVLYAQVPPEIADQENEPAGWLEVGPGDDSYRYLEPPETRRIQPEPGLSVLFPSYFFHRTHPFESDQQRICLPFDILAA